jgi:hypothetical protein
MIVLETRLRVEGISGKEVFDFLAHPNDVAYQRWWPGTHLQLHSLKGAGGCAGDLIYMDEYIGERRVRMSAVVLEAVPGRRLVWQLRKLVRLPARLTLELADDDGGVAITHTIEAGYRGPGRALDPLLRLYFSSAFAEAMDQHARTEFPLLSERLREIDSPART